jgi:hypothetical protein
MLKLFEKCPACSGPVIITEIKCAHCQLLMRGEFSPGPFSALSEEQFTFVRAFLRARGNLSELEKVLGISYPTIRNKLDEINAALDQGEPVVQANQEPAPTTPPTTAPVSSERQAILQQVNAGTLSAAEALQLFKNLKGG